ncbi:MAG: hypothetical protein HRT45_02240 [Bdellovibrionales bacterium]|nr:hypothetical protein [Bdellovibrionales bacterium]
MAQLSLNFPNQIKETTESMSVYILKIISGLMLAMTVSLIFQEIIGFEALSFVLLSSTILIGFMRVVRSWRVVSILVFDLVCILTALLLRMYILIAPGA